jgi:phenylalanine-4-hydroxylase
MGTYDMAVGSDIVSAFSGPVDPDGFKLFYPVPEEKTHKISHSAQAKKLHQLYGKVRDIREQNCGFATLPGIWQELIADHHMDWLCAMEILELLSEKKIRDGFYEEVINYLRSKKTENEAMTKLIDDGVALIK